MMATTCLTLIGVARVATRIVDAQRAQVAADAAALSCVIYGTDSADEAAHDNDAQLLDVGYIGEQCRVVVRHGTVSRSAFAMLSRNDDLPTLQR